MKINGMNEPIGSNEPNQREPSGRSKLKTILGMASIMLAGGLIVGGILAYQTDTDEATNIFTVGEVKITATEPNFPTKDDPEEGRVDGVPDECELVVPHETLPKDPSIQNVGINDAVVFFRITNPAEVLNLINDDGTRIKDILEDLFWMKQLDDPDDFHDNHFDENWIELRTLDRELVKCEGINNEGNGKTYIFGYHVVLKPGESTTTLFDKVQNKKYGSRTIEPDEIEQIKVEAFAIQSEEIKKAGVDMSEAYGTVSTEGELDEETLTHIYKVFVNQNQADVGKGSWKQ